MSDKRYLWLVIGLLALTSLACNAFAGSVEPALTLPPPPTASAQAAPEDEAGETEIAEMAPTATLPAESEISGTDVSSGQAIVTMLVDLNVRSGPGVQYDRIGFMFKDESTYIVGKDPVSGWWKIQCPPRATSTECWVSGGEKFTTAANDQGVPVASIPPTPTPVPPTPVPGTENAELAAGLIVYSAENRLSAAPLNLFQDAPAVGEPLLLGKNANPMTPFMSPDGLKVAYLVSKQAANELHLVNVDGSEARLLVRSVDLPLAGDWDKSGFAALIGQVAWLPDSQGLAFNTNVTNLDGPGFGSQEDLWTVALDGTMTQRLAAWEGGGFFALADSGQVLMSQSEKIVRANVDGSDREELLAFDFINTASEYIYYPLVQWVDGGRMAYVAIPGSEPFTPDASAVLWRIPAVGAAEQVGKIPGTILFHPVIWSDQGRRLAYTQLRVSSDNPPPRLVLGDGAGQTLTDYASSPTLRFFSWSPGGRHFLYAVDEYYAVGQVDQPAVEIDTPGATAVEARWLNASSFVVAAGAGGTWYLESGTVSGQTTRLFSPTADQIRFDVWVP